MFNVPNPKIQSLTCPQLRIKEMMKRFATVFEDTLGECTQATARLFLKPGANCVFRPKRPVSIAAMKMTEDELHIMNNTISALVGMAAYLDGIIVEEELQGRVDKLLEHIEKYGFHLRADKCQFFLTSVKFLGSIFDSTGRRPNSDETRVIAKVPALTDLSSLRSFLGSLNQLLPKDTLWEWSPACEEAFEKLKSMPNSELLLTHYDPSLPIVLVADASGHGIGAVISHISPDGSDHTYLLYSHTGRKELRINRKGSTGHYIRSEKIP
ncbi:unnamed protein product [Hymenolepis diminuta]|uniref:RT_RNaseH_2 domain-containing protein n=1 Tax=Hymenolepis diminuta TaxID=6216 RepID=A0A0R3SRR0_HYMDI|nr:unnamed protein product [Hymenolepis diminuta]